MLGGKPTAAWSAVRLRHQAPRGHGESCVKVKRSVKRMKLKRKLHYINTNNARFKKL